jgi:hypothetical protein
MQIGKSTWQWLRVVPLTVGLTSGILSIIREFLLFAYPGKVQERLIFWASVRIAFVISAGIAWWIEHEARVEAERKIEDEEPKIIFGLLGSIDWTNVDSFGEYVFTLTNYGKRPAIYTQVQPVRSYAGVLTLHFQNLDILPGDGHYHPIQHWIAHGTTTSVLDKRKLWEFLRNCPAHQKTEEFDIVINFKDMQEQKEQKARMRLDLATMKLSIDQN